MKLKLKESSIENIIIYSISGVIVILCYLFFTNLSILKSTLFTLLRIMMPFIIGFSMAFIILPLHNIIENKLLANLKFKEKTKRSISVGLSMIALLLILSSFFVVLIPQLYSSSTKLVEIINDKDRISVEISKSLPILKPMINTISKSSEELLKLIVDNIYTLIPSLLNLSYSFMISILNFLIGLIITIYILLDKERFKRQFKMVIYALLNKNHSDRIIDLSRFTGKMFYQFIFGKTLDSLIIGIICFICTSLLNMPYALLISFIVGITNMIPVFGPFIGAVPCIFILLIVDPIKSVWFAIFILILQQVDGNIIGPYILGDSMGLPSLWIMFSIIVGGGFFGIVGMFIGVPVFSVIYFLVKNYVTKILKDKEIKV